MGNDRNRELGLDVEYRKDIFNKCIAKSQAPLFKRITPPSYFLMFLLLVSMATYLVLYLETNLYNFGKAKTIDENLKAIESSHMAIAKRK